MSPVRVVSSDQFCEEIRQQGAPGPIDIVVICTLCKSPQSIRDFMEAGLPEEEAAKYAGFSCVGRITGAPAARRIPDGKPCDWTLGALLPLHELEVVTPDGKAHPHFELATKEQADNHRAKPPNERYSK